MAKITELDEHTLAKAAHYLFCHPRATPGEIKEKLEKWGIEIGAHATFTRIIPELIDRRWLRLEVKQDIALGTKIYTQGFNLEAVTVTQTDYIADLALHAAYQIRDIFAERAQQKANVHIGFSGGNTTRKVFQELVHLLAKPDFKLPNTEKKTLYCHALVAGFDDGAPGTDPSSFFTYLDDCQTSFEKKFVLLQAPAFVPKEQLSIVLNFPRLKKAQVDASKLDLIVTSAASFQDKHSQLRRYYEANHPNIVKRLEDNHCLGDMLWLPINNQGPIDVSDYEYRPVTLLELQDLPARIRDGMKVLLVIGSCADPSEPCEESKAPIVNTMLNLQSSGAAKKYITHLVVDRDTAELLLSTPARSVSA